MSKKILLFIGLALIANIACSPKSNNKDAAAAIETTDKETTAKTKTERLVRTYSEFMLSKNKPVVDDNFYPRLGDALVVEKSSNKAFFSFSCILPIITNIEEVCLRPNLSFELSLESNRVGDKTYIIFKTLVTGPTLTQTLAVSPYEVSRTADDYTKGFAATPSQFEEVCGKSYVHSVTKGVQLKHYNTFVVNDDSVLERIQQLKEAFAFKTMSIELIGSEASEDAQALSQILIEHRLSIEKELLSMSSELKIRPISGGKRALTASDVKISVENEAAFTNLSLRMQTRLRIKMLELLNSN